MTTPLPSDPYSVASSLANPGAAGSQVPGAALGANMMTINTSQLNVTSDVAGGLFGYTGAPASGSLFFSMTPAGGTDPYGNTYPTGLTVTQGQLSGVNLIGIGMDNTSVLSGSTFNQGNIVQPAMQGGTATSTVHILNQSGGQVISYSSSTITTSFTAASASGPWTAPTGVTQVRVQCWGSGAGGGGGGTISGGEGGGGGEYAEEPALTVVPGAVYNVLVGAAGNAGSTGSPGQTGGDTVFQDQTGTNLVWAHAGQAGFNYIGGSGGTGSANTIHFDGGAGATDTGPSGGCGGGSSAGTGAAGNAGTSSTGTSGGAGGSAPANGGAGGAGGANGGNGVAGSAPGGAGGGAGSSSGAGLSHTNTYNPTHTYSYYGSTSTYGSGPYGKRNTDGYMYQGAASGYINLTGDQYSFALYNYSQINSDLTGATINWITLTLQNVHSWYSAGMYVVLGYSTYTGVFGDPFQPGGGTHQNAGGHSWIAQGNTSSFTVTSWLSAHVGVDFTSIALGTAASSGVSGSNLNYYGYFTGGTSGPVLKVNFTTGGAVDTAGAGADGKVIISYSSSTSLVGAISPNAGSDGLGNNFAAGVTSTQKTFLGQSSAPPSPSSGNAVVFADSNGSVKKLASTGRVHFVPEAASGGGGQTVTQASFTAISDGYSIASGDVVTGTTWRLTAWGHGTFGSTAQDLHQNIQGGNAEVDFPAAQQSVSGNCLWKSTAIIRFTGASTANLHLEMNVSGFPGASGWTAQGNTTGYTVSFPYTFQIFAHWASTTGAPTITCDGTTLERLAN